MYIQPWGIRNNLFDAKPEPKSDYVNSILSSLGKENIFLFWPESISPYEHIDKFINALSLIKWKKNLKVLVFSGHQDESDDFYIKMRALVDSLGLDFVELNAGNYLPYMDIMALWKRADLSIKLSSKDQLSNGIIEAIYFETPMILNNWLPYQKFREFGFDVALTELNPADIARNIDAMLENLNENKQYYSDQVKQNKELIIKNFNFDINIASLVNDLASALQKEQSLT
jgi:glycosyltransferase involved in cell wall biosynthesis